jgi:glucokinase
MIIGLDVGGTNARGLLIDPTSRTVVERAKASSAGSGPVVVATLVEIIRELERRHEASVDVVGLGVAGLITTDGTVRYSPNLPRLVEYRLGPELADALGVPVSAMNDATAGTWAEAELGAGRGADDFAFVALGTGIGTGFVVGGRLIRGSHGFAGEAGHMVVEADGPTHITGQQGPWEYYASGSALGRRGREAAQDGRFDAAVELAGGVGAITGLHVADALAAGDDDARRVFDEFCRDVARGCANLALVLDPQRIVIGGGLTGIGEPLRRGVDDWLDELLLGSEHRPRVEVVLAALGDDAGALGAALVAMENDHR